MYSPDNLRNNKGPKAESPKFDRIDPELTERLAQLKAAIERNEARFRTFETESGFSGTVSYDTKGLPEELTLRVSGLTSVFSVDATGVSFIELRGPDQEHVTTPVHIRAHKDEAERLFNSGELSRYRQNEDGQYELLQ